MEKTTNNSRQCLYDIDAKPIEYYYHEEIVNITPKPELGIKEDFKALIYIDGNTVYFFQDILEGSNPNDTSRKYGFKFGYQITISNLDYYIKSIKKTGEFILRDYFISKDNYDENNSYKIIKSNKKSLTSGNELMMKFSLMEYPSCCGVNILHNFAIKKDFNIISKNDEIKDYLKYTFFRGVTILTGIAIKGSKLDKFFIENLGAKEIDRFVNENSDNELITYSTKIEDVKF